MPITIIDPLGNSDNLSLASSLYQGSVSVEGRGGNDKITTQNGDDTVSGGTGNDSIWGNSGRDFISGNENNDLIYGGFGNDFLFGDDNNDVIYGDEGFDYISGGAGNDFLDGGDNTDSLGGGAGNDSLSGGAGIDRLWGDAGNDTLDGGTNFDVMSGGAGDDYYFVDDVNDIVRESQNSGNDTVFSLVNYISTSCTETIRLGGSAISIRAQQWSELLVGNEQSNIIYANVGDDTVLGGQGNDTLLGEWGNDILVGGLGDDSLTGAWCADTFSFNTGSSFRSIDLGIDTITDFDPSQDTISLSRATFTRLTNGISFATVTSDALAATNAAFITYNRSNGKLFYNENGSVGGLGNGGQFATLSNLASLTGANFVLSEQIFS